MKRLAQPFWWLQRMNGSPGLRGGLPGLCVNAAATILVGWFCVRSGYPAVTYAALVILITFLFHGLSAPLQQLACSEALRLLPGLIPSLTRSILRCVLLLSGLGAIISFIVRDWLPLAASFYVASVAACLIPPRADRQGSAYPDLNQLKQLGADHLGWPAILLLSLPVPALSLAAAQVVLVAMALLGAGLLLSLPHRLGRMQAPTAPSHGVWRQPSFAVFACALVLAVLSVGSTPFLVYFVLPQIGLTALGREAPGLRAMLGRMWLVGMSRRRLCLFCLRRLALAFGQELAVYLLFILLAWVSGLIKPETLAQFAGIFFACLFGSGMHAFDKVLQGEPGPSTWQFALAYLPLCLPLGALLFLSLEGMLLSVYGLLALLASLAGLAWAIAGNCRRFEMTEL